MGNTNASIDVSIGDESYRKLITLLGDNAPVLWRLPAKFKSPDDKTRAFFTKAYFRPACDGKHVGGAMIYIGSKDAKGHFTESLRQTMKTDQQIDDLAENDPYFFSPTRLFNHKTEIERLAEKGNKGRNTYATLGLFWGNSFKNDGRERIENVKSIDRFVIDIDGPDHRVLTKEEKKMISAEVQAKVGTADFVIDSGTGLQFHYIFKERTDVFRVNRYYNFISNRLCKRAEKAITSVPGCGADQLGITSYYRLPKTYNLRSQTKATVLEFHDLQPFDFDCLIEYYNCNNLLITKKTRERKCERVKTKSSENRYTYKNYASDLEHDYLCLASVYGSEGCRNKMLYYYLYNVQCSVKDEDVLSAKAAVINKKFKEPLPDYEVSCILRSAITEFQIHNKIFSLGSQLEKIGISLEEAADLDLLLPVTEEQKKERQKQAAIKQGNRRKEIRHNQKLEKINWILALYQKGLTIQKISEATGVCRQTVSKWIKEYA